MTAIVPPYCPAGYKNLPPEALPYVLPIEVAVAKWWDPTLHEAGKPSLDVYTVFAVMRRESGFGKYLTPPGPAGVADAGHGRGLMQIDDRPHPGDLIGPDGLRNCEWVKQVGPDGVPLWQRADCNIDRGVWQLATNLTVVGSVPAAIAAYNCGIEKVQRVLTAVAGSVSTDALVHALDLWTTRNGKRDPGYVRDVLNHQAQYLPKEAAPNG